MTTMRSVGICVSPIIGEGCLCNPHVRVSVSSQSLVKAVCVTSMRSVGICESPIISDGCLCDPVEKVWVSVRAQLIS